MIMALAIHKELSVVMLICLSVVSWVLLKPMFFSSSAVTKVIIAS